jgi:RNA polymerase sigma factor (sigma-70 family)
MGQRRIARDGRLLDELEGLYRRHLDAYCSVAAAILQDRESARDAVHDAFAAAVRARASFRRNGPFEAWLWRTVVNVALDHRRRRGARAVVWAGVADLATSNGHASGPRDDVQRALAALPERQRLVLFLRYYADLDYRTIADVVGITTGAVGATLHSARAALRLTLEEVSP